MAYANDTCGFNLYWIFSLWDPWGMLKWRVVPCAFDLQTFVNPLRPIDVNLKSNWLLSLFCRPRTREPARRRVHQRAAASEPHPAENRWTRGGGRSTLRNLPTAASLARMCVENPQSLPGDRLDSAGRDWRQQAESRHARNWESHRGHEERKSGHFLVGNPRTVDQGGHLWQAIRAIGEFHQPTFASKEWRRRWNRNS